MSSTNNWLIEEGVRELGVPPERILCARVAVKDGVITSELLDVPTDEGKTAALATAGVGAVDVVFGNSIHDVPMLAMARHPFPVNPTPALVGVAAQRNWPVFYPESLIRP